MAPPRSTRRLNLVLALGSTLVALAAGEIVVRWLRPQPLEAAYVWPDGTLRHLPSLTHRYTRAGLFSNVIHYNALGLRGPEVAAARAAGTPRVLFLGDSFIEGKQVGEEEVLTAALMSLSRERGAPLEVINAGVSGYGTAEELLLWERLGRELRPDLVLVGLYPNDVGNNVERGLFALQPSGEPATAREPKRPRARWLYALRHQLAARSHLFALVKSGLHRSARGASAIALDGRDGAFLEAEQAFAALPSSGEPPEGWRLTLALLDALRRSVEGAGARFTVVLLPTRFQVMADVWQRHAEGLKLDPSRYDLEAPQEVLARWSAATGARVIDLLPAFRARSGGPPLYYLIDTHFTPAGHRLAAETILEELR